MIRRRAESHPRRASRDIMQNDAKRFRNPYGRDAAPLRFRRSSKSACRQPLYRRSLPSRFSGILKKKRVSVNLTMVLMDAQFKILVEDTCVLVES